MTETTVVTSDDGGEDPSVLAEAAVLSAAVAGAAAAKAGDASDDAASAKLKADQAQGTADAALSVSADKVSEERARVIAREEAAATIAALVASAKPEPVADPAPAADGAPAVDPQVAPPSVAKANGKDETGHKRTWADRWYGND
jgi:hypothetical protein